MSTVFFGTNHRILFRFIAEDQTAVLTITVNSTSSNGLVSSKST